MSKIPFKDFYTTEDIAKCTNKQCKDRCNCFRYMGKSDADWQSMLTIKGKLNKDTCDCYWPYHIWRDASGKEYLLKEIVDQHLLAIIIHLFERIQFNGEDNLIKLVKEFIKEARKRKLIS